MEKNSAFLKESLCIFGSLETILLGSRQSIKSAKSHSFDRRRQNVSFNNAEQFSFHRYLNTFYSIAKSR